MEDLIIKGNNIFDSVKDEPFKGAVVVSGNKIKEVLTSHENLPEAERVIDAGDKLIMSAFNDNHVHLIMGGLFEKFPSLFDCKSEEECARKVFDLTKGNKDSSKWVLGFGWYDVFWDDVHYPTKDSLDMYFKDTPVLLLNAEAHGGWANSKAMEICGISKDTKDPFGGKIFRDEDGNPTGYFNEAATGLITKYAYDFDEETQKELVIAFQKRCNSYGITSVTDVMPYFHGNMGSLKLYSSLDKSGELNLRINAAPDILGDLDKVVSDHEKFKSDKIQGNFVKQFLDGTLTGHTSLTLNDYKDMPGFRGEEMFPIKEIEKAVKEAHKRELSIKLHACADRSLRYALDYYESAIKEFGKNSARHQIEHCELVDDDDIKRFGELGTIPSVQPEHITITDSYDINPYRVVLGDEKSNETWPFRKMLDSAGVLAFGSDCPVVDSNPYPGIFRAVTRLHNDGTPEGGFNGKEKLTMAEALKFYTAGSAFAQKRENEIGTIESGKFADIAIVDTNLFDCDIWDIKNATTELTVFDGKVVFEKN